MKSMRISIGHVFCISLFFCSLSSMEQLPEPKSREELLKWVHDTFKPFESNLFKLIFMPGIHARYVSPQRWSAQPGFSIVDSAIKFWVDGISKYKIKQAVQQYKIHLMPETYQIPQIMKQVLAILQADKELRTGIYRVKAVIATPEEIYAQQRAPKIVIYVFGKQHAQKAVDEMYHAFKHKQGTGLEPAFNERVTDFIFFAQGDRRIKTNCAAQSPDLIIYELPDMVYYSPEKLKKCYEVDVEEKDFYLINPAKLEKEQEPPALFSRIQRINTTP